MSREILLGDEAIGLGAIHSGLSGVYAYPGTPSTEILENLAHYPGLKAEWASNEKVALDNAIGASFGGARTLAAMKHVGVNVAADSLMSLSYVGTFGGLVLVSADDPGAFSSQNEQDNRQFTDQIPGTQQTLELNHTGFRHFPENPAILKPFNL